MDEVRYKQPAGIYWLQAASVKAFGDVHAHRLWAHRLPSVLNGVIAVLLAAGIAAALFGRKAGLAAGAMLACCLSLTYEAHSAKTDATLCMLILAAQACLVRLRLDQAANRPRGWGAAVLFWLILGLGIMVKGPIPVMVTGLTIACVSLWERSWDLVKRLRLFPLVLIPLGIALPWLIAIQIKSHGQFLALAGGKNFAGKIAGAQESHGGPPGYHLLLVNGMFWPSALFAVAAIPAVWKNRRDPRVRFLLSWLLPAWLVFELSGTKLPHYPLPTYAAIAALTAGVWFGDLAPAGPRAKWVGRIYAAVWTLAGLALCLAPPILFHQYQKAVNPTSVVLALTAVVGLLTCLALFLRNQLGRALTAAVVAALFAWFNLFGWTAPRITTIWITPRVVEAVRAHAPCPHPVLASAPFQEASLAYLAGTGTMFVDPAQVADHLAQDPACGLALIGAKEYPDFAARLAADGVMAEKVSEIDGMNYAKGKTLQLGLYRAAIPAAGSSPSAPSPRTLP